MKRVLRRTAVSDLFVATVAGGLLAIVLAGSFAQHAVAQDEQDPDRLVVERTTLDEDGIGLMVRMPGPDPMRIAQVQVDDAYWTFTQDPSGVLDPSSTARLHIPYPWVWGETHHIVMVTEDGGTIEHTIEDAETGIAEHR